MKPATGRISGRWWSRRRRGKWRKRSEVGGRRSGTASSLQRTADRGQRDSPISRRCRRRAHAESRPSTISTAACAASFLALASERTIAIADSKALYKPGPRPAATRARRACGARGDRSPGSVLVRAWCSRATPIRTASHRQLCWHDGFDCQLPIDATSEELVPLGDRLNEAGDEAGIRPLAFARGWCFPRSSMSCASISGARGRRCRM